MDLLQCECPKRVTGYTRRIDDNLHYILLGMRNKTTMSYVQCSYTLSKYIIMLDKDIANYHEIGKKIATKNIDPFTVLAIELGKTMDVTKITKKYGEF